MPAHAAGRAEARLCRWLRWYVLVRREAPRGLLCRDWVNDHGRRWHAVQDSCTTPVERRWTASVDVDMESRQCGHDSLSH
jgi:hypothetical protein